MMEIFAKSGAASLALTIGLLGSVAFGGGAALAAECKGKAKSACSSDKSCTWVKSYKTKTGKNVDGYCRKIGGKAKASSSKKSSSAKKAVEEKKADSKTASEKKADAKKAAQKPSKKADAKKASSKKKAAVKKKSAPKKASKKKDSQKKDSKKN
ncbi:MAG: hypothetical protein OIF56_00430 [Cohaesibacter sp.]|nr:hypothetical protein [Cohaesibacter sp.]